MSRVSPCAVVATSALVFVTATAHAQVTPQEAQRRERIAQATAARNAGDHARALTLATQAAQIRMSVSLRLMIAEEHAALGGESHQGEAFRMAEACVREATADASVPQREQVLRDCTNLMERTRPRPASTPAAPVVSTPAAPPAAVTVAPPRVGEGAVRVTTPARGPGPGPWLVVGGGGALVALGGVFFALQAQAQLNQAVECPRMGSVDVCRDSAALANAARFHDQAVQWNTAAWVSMGVGAAAVAGGLVWYALARRGDEAPRTALRWSVAPVREGALTTVEGVW